MAAPLQLQTVWLTATDRDSVEFATRWAGEPGRPSTADTMDSTKLSIVLSPSKNGTVSMTSHYNSRGAPLTIAHRGFSGADDDGSHALENSALAFEQAVALGCEWLETDVHATADGTLIAFHDDVLDRVTDAAGVIADLPWRIVREAKIAGSQPILTMEELFDLLPGAKFNIDVKAEGAVALLADLIERRGLHDRVRVASFSESRRRGVLGQLSRPVRSSPGQELMRKLWVASRLGRVGDPVFGWLSRDIDALQIPEHHGNRQVLDARLIRAAHAAGVEVHVWTVNDPADMARLIDAGVDALITDRADLAFAVSRERISS